MISCHTFYLFGCCLFAMVPIADADTQLQTNHVWPRTVLFPPCIAKWMESPKVRKRSSCGTSRVPRRSLSRNAARSPDLRGGRSVSITDDAEPKKLGSTSGALASARGDEAAAQGLRPCLFRCEPLPNCKHNLSHLFLQPTRA